MENRVILSDDYEDLWLFLDVFDSVVKLTFKNAYVNPEHYDKIRLLYSYLQKALKMTDLSVTHKLHWLINHCSDWICKNGMLLGCLSEQDGEALQVGSP